ncbi:glycosyltransferase family 9 protein [Roseibium sp. Sym1]|uniref:tetratricopeptide repeat-containing glycosyltransferase family protein n=1 Tax=Roseibium sp. Sym1 TaxID=3016006 RepID=UPI0022B54FAA|nr:tetratricopeptide repeat protein [Roseibium sp. Sym1]
MTGKDNHFLADRLYQMALRSFGREQTETARSLADACLEICPDHGEAWLLQAETHLYAERETAAIACLVRAAQIGPTAVDALYRLTGLYLQAGRPVDATVSARRLLAIRPSDREAHYLLAVALSRAGKRTEALVAFRELLAADARDRSAAVEAAWLLLGERQFGEGWPLWEQRPMPDPFPGAPEGTAMWTGEPLEGKTVLVLPEGGHGDIIWAARFLPGIKAAGGEVHVKTRPALTSLLADLDGVDHWVGEADSQCDYDYWIPILSLPARLVVSDPAHHSPPKLRSIPAPDGRLDALLARAKAPFRVGILWSGNVDYGGNADRAAGLRDFLPLAELPFVQLYSLQKGPPQRELIEGGFGDLIIDCDDYDFAETAALIEALDLIIMTDSAVAHIAGALGTPVWVLLDTFAHWYHGFEGSLSDWYPSMRFFRQSRPRQWQDVMARVSDELVKFSDEPCVISQHRSS